MNKPVEYAGAFALLCAGFALIAGGRAISTVARDADTVTAHAVARIDDLKRLTDQSYDLVRATRQTVDHVDRAAIDERIYLEQELPATMGRLNAVLDSTRETIAGVQPVTEAAARSLDETTARLHDLQPVEAQATAVLKDADVVVSDPHIRETLAHVDDAAGSLSSTAQHLDGTAADAQQAVHAFLHPSWKVRLVDWLGKAAHTAGGWF